MAIRINRYLSESGYCTRREADGLVLEGRVEINGDMAEFNSKVEEHDVVSVDGEEVFPRRAINFKPIMLKNSTPKKVKEKEKKQTTYDRLKDTKEGIKALKKAGIKIKGDKKSKPTEEERATRATAPNRPKRKGYSKNHTPKKSF